LHPRSPRVAPARQWRKACTRQGIDVSSDDGRRGVLSGDAIVSGRRHAIEPVIAHAGVIIGNRSSVIVGPGALVGKGVGAVPLDNPSTPNKARCPVLDGISYCY
jgi:hypothetical protein